MYENHWAETTEPASASVEHQIVDHVTQKEMEMPGTKKSHDRMPVVENKNDNLQDVTSLNRSGKDDNYKGPEDDTYDRSREIEVKTENDLVSDKSTERDRDHIGLVKSENINNKEGSNEQLSNETSGTYENEKIIKNIRKLLTEKESSAVHDETVMRFYIASGKKLHEAAQSISNLAIWRDKFVSRLPVVLKNNVPLLISLRGINGFPDCNYNGDAQFVPPEYNKFWKYMGGCVLHKTDSRGRPLLIDRLGRYDVASLTRHSTPEIFCEWHVANMEFLVNNVFDACGSAINKNVTNGITIMDCKGVGLKHASINAFKFLRKISETDAMYYPERLHKLYLVNASPVVVKIWNIAKKWVNSDIINKVVIGQNLYDLVDRKEIPPENVPSYLGGTCKCPDIIGGCTPSPNEIIALNQLSNRK